MLVIYLQAIFQLSFQSFILLPSIVFQQFQYDASGNKVKGFPSNLG